MTSMSMVRPEISPGGEGGGNTRAQAHTLSSQPHQLLGLSDSCSWWEGAEVGGAKHWREEETSE